MPEPKRQPREKAESNLGLEGFDKFFDGPAENEKQVTNATTVSEVVTAAQVEKVIDRMGQLLSLAVEQRVEAATIANQLLENQRQLIATQQILVRLMEKSIELTRHITSIEEKLPALFEMPRVIEALKDRVAQLEGIEI